MTNSPRGIRRTALGVFAFFALLGPLIGGSIYAAPLLIAGLVNSEWSLAAIPEIAASFLGIYLFAMMFAYLIGGGPASLCGLVLGVLVLKGVRITWFLAAIVGAVSTVPVVLLLYFQPSVSALPALAINILRFGILGGVSALACLAVFRRFSSGGGGGLERRPT